MPSPGELVLLTIEKPAGGGKMIARLNGQVVLIGGVIPGERVTARVVRMAKGVVYATVAQIEDPSPDRRNPLDDPLCGGSLYAHISYPRQLEIKAQVVADSLARIGRLRLPSPVLVTGSREDGYRMRARLHLRRGRMGFFREATHEICDARATRQLLPASCDVLDRVASALGSAPGVAACEMDVSENVDASERVVHVELSEPADVKILSRLSALEGLSGVTIGGPLAPEGSGRGSAAAAPGRAGVEEDRAPGGYRVTVLAGDPHVTDVLSISSRTIRLRRHVLSFFQGNRYLLHELARRVVDRIGPGSAVVDLYAGTGLFAIAAAACGAQVTAVEGDRAAARDLHANASQAAGAVHPVHRSVEAFASGSLPAPDVVILDPPRTGVSREAMNAIVRLAGRRIVYVSCDAATLARDARRLVDSGYVLGGVQGLDLFPNTPHVETIAVFERGL